MHTLTVAFCTFKRADRLETLVDALRAQSCPVPFEILAVNNNSPDDTLDVLARLQTRPGAPLHVVTEKSPGIVPARNRAVDETRERDILVFIDDDELPQADFLEAAYDAIAREGAQCAGGRIDMDFSDIDRPVWLDDSLLGFLAAVDHGPDRFWIRDADTPVWTANIAYDMRLFRDDPALRFDARYNRAGVDVGGGEDAAMLRALLERGARIRYRPDMIVRHAVEPWRLRKSYFLKLHYRAGLRAGLHHLPDYSRVALGVPPFLVGQFLRHTVKAAAMQATGCRGALRQAMNAAHALGSLAGYRRRGSH
jgi:glycosyltransferase involved in cell wall biosynthesis